MLWTAGCLLKDETTTWYLEPTGAVTWSVAEQDVRSDAQTTIDRDNEELTYITAARARTHPMARGFAQLGSTEIRTRILRDTAPYSVVTEAKFLSLESLGQQLIVHLGLVGTSFITREAGATTWTFSVRDPHAEDAVARPDDDLSALTNDLDGLKVVLVQGKFAGVRGFHLSPDARIATIDDLSKADENATLVLQLRWTDAR